MNNDIFGGFMAVYIIASALYSFTLLRFSDTDDLRMFGFNIWQNVFKELFLIKMHLELLSVLFVLYYNLHLWCFV